MTNCNRHKYRYMFGEIDHLKIEFSRICTKCNYTEDGYFRSYEGMLTMDNRTTGNHIVINDIQFTKRTWKERLFSIPWNPFKNTKQIEIKLEEVKDMVKNHKYEWT